MGMHEFLWSACAGVLGGGFVAGIYAFWRWHQRRARINKILEVWDKKVLKK